MKVKTKKLSLIALSLFTAISMFFGIKGFIPNSTMAESDATPVTEVFYDFEDGDAHSSEGYRTMKTMEISKEVVNEDGSTSTVTNTVLTNTTGWAGVYFHEIPMENLGKNWEISLDVHLADATAGIGEFRLGFYSTPNPGTNNGYDSSAVKSYFTATSFTTTKVLTTYEEGVIRSANAGEVVENRITYRYRDGRMYMNIAPWGSTNIEEEGVWQQVSGRIDLVGKTGYFTLQLGSNVGLDYIDNLSIKAIEGDGDAAFVDGSTPIWGTFKKNYYTDENGNEILNGEVYLTATEDYHIMYYKEKLPETFFISFDITDGSTRTDSYRIGIGCGTNADGSPVKETTYSTTAGVTLHHEYYYSAGMLDSYRSDGTRSTTTSTTITEATPYFSVRLTKGIKLENMVIDFNAMEDDTNVSAINNSISGKEYWLNGKTRRWDGTSGAYVWDDQTWVRHFDGERIKYELKYAGDRYERSILSDHYTEGDDENNYYRIDDSKDLQFSFDLGFAANTDIDVNTGTDARIALFMKNTDNAMSVDSGVYLLVTSWTKKVNGWVVYFNVTFGNTQTSEATSTSVFTTDPYLDVEFIYEADSCAMSVIVEDVNVINRRAIDITTGQGEANANGLILDRRYIGFLLKNRDLSLSNIEIKEGDEVVIDESNAGVAEKFTAITGKFQDVITPGNKVLAQVKGGYSVALSNDMLPKNYKVSMDLYTSVMRSLDDPSSQTSANSDQARIILMTNYVSGEGMESKGFAVTFGASMYRYARNLGTTGAGFNTTQLTKFYGDGNVYHLEFVYINGVMEFYVDGKLAVSEGYTVNRDGDYVCFQFNNESTYIGNYEVEDLTYDINFGIDNEELGTVKINDVDAVSGEIAVLKGEAVKLTATANANAIIKAVFVNDSEILVTSTTDFEAVVLDAIEANAEIVVRFAERDSLALGESVVYDAMTSTQSNDWKENVYDYSGLKVVRYNDYNGTTENPNYTFNLGPGVAGGKGYITYKISLNDLSAEAGQSVAGIVIATRAKLSVFDEKVRQQCYIDFYVGYEDPIVNGYDGFTYAGKVEPKAGQVNAATYNASNKTILSIDNTQEYVYVQVRMGTADSNWITLRELGFSSCSYQINDSFTAKYDDATDSSYTGWMNGLYDYSNITVKGFDGLFAIAPNGPTGYITYKIDASNIENLDKIIIDARAKLTNWSGAPNANYYINYYVGYADPAANGYDSFALVYEAPVMYNGQDGFNQTQLTNKAYTFEIQPEQSFVYLQIRIGGNSGNWICLRETSINFVEAPQTTNVTINYGVSYTETVEVNLNATLDTSIINIKEGFIAVDSKLYTNVACTEEYDMSNVVSGEIVLYVKVINGYIIYELDEGVNAAENKAFYEAAAGLAIADPTKEGYTFGGWYLDADKTVEFTGITAETTGNITLYAEWTPNTTGPGYTPDVPPVVEKPEDGEGDMTSASVTIGTDLSMKYEAVVGENDSVAMIITMNGKQVVVSGDTEDGTVYSFNFQNIAPHLMGENISAQLVINNEVKDEVAEYSVYQNLVNTFNRATTDELKTLVADTLNYGAMAQAYKNHNVDNFVNANAEIAAFATNFEPITESDFANVTENEVEGYTITGAGVFFDYVNNVYVKFTAGADYKVTVSVDGGEETEVSTIKYDGKVYRAYSPDISALGFDRVYTFKLYSGETLVQTVNYSVKTFVYNKQNGEDATANLAKALYNYGLATVAYKASK